MDQICKIEKAVLTNMPQPESGGTKIGRTALNIAINELKAGAGEIGGNNLGPWVLKYLNGLAAEGSSWCAAFVSYCFSKSAHPMPFEYTVSARHLFNQFKAKGWIYKVTNATLPLPGDVIFWWRDNPQSWQGHTALVHHSAKGKLYAIEGNRTSKVEGFCYQLDELKQILGFGRAPDTVANSK